VASATASSSRSDNDAMSVISWRRSDEEIDAVPPSPFGLMGVAGDLGAPACAGRSSSPMSLHHLLLLLDLPSQAPSASIIIFMERDS